jgi:hypothetical protein
MPPWRYIAAMCFSRVLDSQSAGADLKTYHDARMGLPDDKMQKKLTNSVMDLIPEPSCPLQVAFRVRRHPLPAGPRLRL